VNAGLPRAADLPFGVFVLGLGIVVLALWAGLRAMGG
jgi:hypothetical protein